VLLSGLAVVIWALPGFWQTVEAPESTQLGTAAAEAVGAEAIMSAPNPAANSAAIGLDATSIVEFPSSIVI
jgi:hypothetical protein